MTTLKTPPPEIVDVVRSRLREANGDERILEWAALGFEEALHTLHAQFQRGEISFGRLAEELGLSVWETESLLEKLDRSTTNL